MPLPTPAASVPGTPARSDNTTHTGSPGTETASDASTALARPAVEPPAATEPASMWGRLFVVALLTGVGAGLAGMSLALLLRAIQHVAYGYSPDALISKLSFLYGVSHASPERRLIVMTIAGAVAGFGWWAVYRFGQPLISIKKAVDSGGVRMPVGSTLAHALLQIITVALGSPLGREVAPREVAALWAGWLAHAARLPVEHKRLIVACGAGAGLAAVYNVPLGGAVFVLEVLLATWKPTAVAVALGTSVVAALVAWVGLGNESQYTLLPALHFTLSPSFMLWSIVMGPVFGFAAWMFTRTTVHARASASGDWRLIVGCVLNFAIIGALAALWPQLPGNGKGPTQLSMDGSLSIELALVLLVLKLVVVHSTLRVGAQGGLLTPGMTIGALMAVVLGGLWSLCWPGAPLGAYAIVGAGAFLATSMAMPVTAIVLVAEFTRLDHDLLFPLLCAVAGSTAVAQGCKWALARKTRVAQH